MGLINAEGVYEYDKDDPKVGPALLNLQSAALTNTLGLINDSVSDVNDVFATTGIDGMTTTLDAWLTAQFARRMQTGEISIAISNSHTGTATVTFPVEFASPPRVVANAFGTGAGPYYVSTGTPTKTSVTLQIVHYDKTKRTHTIKVNWIAVLL